MQIKNDRVTNNIPSIVKGILLKRGFKESEFEEFLSPHPQLAYDPFLLSGMQRGVDLLLKTIDEGKKIVIYGDYDVDGVTSVALMLKVLGCITSNIDYYIPSRLDEGYGLNKEAIKQIKDEGCDLLITVDCGIVSREETRYAAEIGLKTIVTDHHNPGDTVAEGIIINPKLPGDEYPFKGLAGVGVAYKFACAIKEKRAIPKSVITEVLELAALGTIADLMPLVDENRTIVKYGLSIMRGARNLGVSKLIDVAGLDRSKLTSTDVSFGLAPRINAAGRLGDASLGVKLLMSEDENEAESLAKKLNEINSLRRDYQQEAFEQCMEKAEEELRYGDFILVTAEGCHEGILGIVAGRIKETLERPTIIIQRNYQEGDDRILYKGTGRSRGRVDLYEMLRNHEDLLVQFGGHSAACGFAIEEDNIEELKYALNEDLEMLLEEDERIMDEEVSVDTGIESEDVSLELVNCISCFEPCGKGNPKPVIMLKNSKISRWRFMGGGTVHASFNVDKVRCVCFNKAEQLYKNIDINNQNVMYNITGYLELNEWQGHANPQFRVIDITSI